MTHILCRNKSDDVWYCIFGQNYINVQKRLKLASFGADFLKIIDENKDHTAKKAQNSDAEWDWLHGENEVVEFENRNFGCFSQFLLKGFKQNSMN